MADRRINAHRREEGRADGVTVRAAVAALVFLALLGCAGFCVEILYDSGDLNAGVPAPGPLTALFVLAATSGLLPVGWHRARYGRRELLATYIIVLAGAPMVSLGILAYMLPHGIYVQYAAGVHPEWEMTFLPSMPAWFSPSQPEAVKAFFEGNGYVPWGLWWTPLATWCSFLLALTGSSSCLAVLLERQWIAHERLSFPLAQIPLGLVAEQPGEQGRLPAAHAFWVGLLISLGLRSWNNLAELIPALPAVPLGPVPLVGAQPGPMAAFGRMELVLWPWLIAIAYLIPKELSFSCWLFWVLRVVLAFIAIAAGATPRSPGGWLGDTAFPAFGFQGFGAIVALSGWALWRARRHLGHALRAGLGRDTAAADPSDSVLYRSALGVLLVCYAWMVYLCLTVGCRLPVAMGLIALILMYYLMWTWVRAETGLGLLNFPLMIDDMVRAMGQAALRPQELITISSLRWTYFPGGGSSANIIPGNVLEGLKVADSARIRGRSLLLGMAAGLVLSLLLGTYVTLTGYYRYGFFGVGATAEPGWLASQVIWGAESIPAYLGDPSDLDLRGLLGIGAGGLTAVGLGMLRLRFWWWPLHPVGFLAAQSWGMHWYYGPFFIGWVAKTLVTRYGGLRVYRRTMPVAVGLVVGDLLAQVLRALYEAAASVGGGSIGEG